MPPAAAGGFDVATAYEIPFEPKAQTFTIALGQSTYRLSTAWNTAAECWVLDIAQPDGTPIVSGIPIITGVDLLKQYTYLNFGGQIFVQNSSDVAVPPGYADLGSKGLVFFVVP